MEESHKKRRHERGTAKVNLYSEAQRAAIEGRQKLQTMRRMPPGSIALIPAWC
jgi:hypothetical protein